MKVLISKKPDSSDLSLLKKWNWQYEVAEALAIEIMPVENIPTTFSTWVISSRNAFHAVKNITNCSPPIIYCVGDWLKAELEKIHNNARVLNFPNMRSLATALKSKNYKSIAYFCGDHHRPELEEILAGSDTEIHKIICYKSIQTFPMVSRKFDAVLLYSPRSAESILSKNHFDKNILMACIGSTTGNFMRSKGYHHIFEASKPNSEILLKELKVYVENNPVHEK